MNASKFCQVVAIIALVCFQGAVGKTQPNGSSRANVASGQAADSGNDKYAAYQIDGFATPSKLAAQRSHTPAGEDERNFAVFTGVVVVVLVFGLVQVFFKKN